MTDDSTRQRDEECRLNGDGDTALTRRTLVRAGAVGLGGLALGSAGAAAQAGDSDESVSRLHTDGRWLKNVDGEVVRLRGMAPADPAFYEMYHPKSAMEVVRWATDEARGWYPNVVRLPVTQHSVENYGSGLDSLIGEVLRPVVDLLAERGIYALVDYHIIRPYTEAASEDAGYDTPPDELVTTFWESVAPAFADDENVVYELFNEPTYPIYWGDNGQAVENEKGEWMLWRDVAQPWVDLVREHAPDTPLVVGSPSWTSRTNFADEYPFEGENLIYAAHIYPDNGTPGEFDDTYGEPAEEVPVVVTEFGWDPESDDLDYGTNSGWGEPFREWVESYDNMGWVAWCFDDSWAPAMFDSPEPGGNEPWTLESGPEEHGGFVKQWLAETSEEMIARMNPSETLLTVGERVTFEVADASAEDHWITSLEWTFDDGTGAEGWWAQHRYDEPGQHTVSLTATNDAGETTTHELALTVRELSEPVAEIDPSATEVSTGERVTFEAEDTSGEDRSADSLAWSFGDGTGAEGWWTEHTYDETGEYTVTLTATGTQGHETTDTVTVTVSE